MRQEIMEMWGPKYPSADLVKAAAAQFEVIDAKEGIPWRWLYGRRGVDNFSAVATPSSPWVVKPQGCYDHPAGSGRCIRCKYILSQVEGRGDSPDWMRLADDGSDKGGTSEGPKFRISISPGAIVISCHDEAKAERTRQRVQDRKIKQVKQDGYYLAEHGEFPAVPMSRKQVMAWSRKSRNNMVRTFCQLDYGPLLDQDGIPAMITLTLPGDWQTVAPTPKHFRRFIKLFQKRWARAWGSELICIWKREFQERGAAHHHMFTMLPEGEAKAFRYGKPLKIRQWLSETWADIVNHPDPEQKRLNLRSGTNVKVEEGLKCADPKRLAIYFSKHGLWGSKEYQNVPPVEWVESGEGVGRYWGYVGLDKCIEAAVVPPQTAIDAKRILQRWSDVTAGRIAKDGMPYTHKVKVPRPTRNMRHQLEILARLAGVDVSELGGPRRTRSVNRRVKRFRNGQNGWIAVNDGANMGSAVARWVNRLAAERYMYETGVIPVHYESREDRRARWIAVNGVREKVNA